MSETVSKQSFNSGATSQDMFVASSNIYTPDEQWENAVIRLNATYRIPDQSEDFTDYDKNNMILVTRLRTHICDLQASIMKYRFSLSEGTGVLSANRSDDKFVQYLKMTDPINRSSTTIGGFQYAASYLFGSSVTYSISGARLWSLFKGSLANEMVPAYPNAGLGTITDPMDYMLDVMREITFRTAAVAGRDEKNNVTQAQQDVEYQGSRLRPIYVTDQAYMIASAILSLLSILAVGATFYGWWQLGRRFSMSPLEMAKAFDAPLLKEIEQESLASMDSLAGTLRERRVRYGEMISSDVRPSVAEPDLRGLRMGLMYAVHKPRAGRAYVR